jgi:hypothetical protein
MHDNNFDLLLLGCPFRKGATFLHHLEFEMDVDYRDTIVIKRRCLVKGELVNVDYTYFARKNEEVIENFDIVAEDFPDIISKCSLPFGTSYKAKLADISDAVLPKIASNVNYLVKPVDMNKCNR